MGVAQASPVKQLSAGHEHVPAGAAHAKPLHAAAVALKTLQIPKLFVVTQPVHAHVPSEGLQAPKFPHATGSAHVGPVKHGGHVHVPSVAQLPPFWHALASYEPHVPSPPPPQHPSHAHVPVEQSQLPWPEQSSSACSAPVGHAGTPGFASSTACTPSDATM